MKLILKYIIGNIYAIDVDSSLEAVGCFSHKYNKNRILSIMYVFLGVCRIFDE
jgi:hypothetical protein